MFALATRIHWRSLLILTAMACSPSVLLAQTPGVVGPTAKDRFEFPEHIAHPNWEKGWTHTLGDPALSGEQDAPCQDGDCTERIAGVLPHNGETVFRLTLPQLSIPGRSATNWASTLTYRSQIDFNGPIGRGWNLTYLTDCRVQEPDSSVTRFAANGTRSSFIRLASRYARWYSSSDTTMSYLR